MRHIMREINRCIEKEIQFIRTAGGSSPPAPDDSFIEVLFENGEIGLWYDPSKPETMFQDYQGKTPVAASGQPVGLILDRSQGLTEGTTVPFEEAGVNWTDNGGGSWTYVYDPDFADNQLTFGDGSATPNNAWAKIEFTVTGLTGNMNVNYKTNVATITANGTYHFILLGTSSGISDFYFYPQDSGADITFTVSAISGRHLAGDHAYQDTPTARPLFRIQGGLRKLEFDGIDDILNSNTVDWSAYEDVSAMAAFQRTGGTFTSNNSTVLSHGYLFSTFINGVWMVESRYTGSDNRTNFISRGTTTAIATTVYEPSRDFIKDVVWSEATISDPSIDIESVNGTSFDNTSTQGTGNYGSFAYFMGGNPFEYVQMDLYAAVARNTRSTDTERDNAVTWARAKSGV